MRLIDVDALMDKLGISTMCDACVYNCTPFCGWKPCPASICEEIAEAPTIKSERKTGKWRHYEGMYYCDQCKSGLDDESPFCPMCGADMRGEQND